MEMGGGEPAKADTNTDAPLLLHTSTGGAPPPPRNRHSEDGDLRGALKMRAAKGDGSANTVFWECTFNHFFPGLCNCDSVGDKQPGERLVRGDIWERFGQPMHFLSLNFMDDEVEANFQMDSTRRNRRWVKFCLGVRSLLSVAVAAWSIGLVSSERLFNDTDTESIRAAKTSYNVIYPLVTGALYLIQWLQVTFDGYFVLRFFQHVTFFWCLVHVTVCLYWVLRIVPATYDPSFCASTWANITDTRPTSIIDVQTGIASVQDQLIKLVLTFQIFFRMRFIYFTYILIITLSIYYVQLVYSPYGVDSPCATSIVDVRFLSIVCFGFILMSYVLELMQRKDFIQASAVYEESRRSEHLLNKILPVQIVEELRLHENDQSIVKHYNSVTVLFADIVSFTTMSARLSPNRLVELLDELFLDFDGLAEMNRLEKIKTIGDCYMAAGGIPTPSEYHAHDVARMGLGMVETLLSGRHVDPITDVPLQVRVGMHSGPAVAGVIGKKKVAYDLWGDAVNTASRMESHGKPMRVHCSADTYELLKTDFVFEERGVMTVKGKGEMCTYFVESEKTTLYSSKKLTASTVKNIEREESHEIDTAPSAGGFLDAAAMGFRAMTSMGAVLRGPSVREDPGSNHRTSRRGRNSGPGHRTSTNAIAQRQSASGGNRTSMMSNASSVATTTRGSVNASPHSGPAEPPAQGGEVEMEDKGGDVEKESKPSEAKPEDHLHAVV